jgi:large subunit ribosomal protein L35
MPKVKTHKGISKRFNKTGTGKITHRASGQDHYNSRESSKTTMNKRRDISMHKSNNTIASRIPYK